MKKNNKLHKIWEKYSRKIKYKEVPTPSDVKEAIAYRELPVLKRIAAKEMEKWHKESPSKKYILLSIKQSDFSADSFSSLVTHLHAMGWDIATRTFKKTYWDSSRVMNGQGNAYYTVPHFEIQIAFPGELVEQIEHVKFTEMFKGENKDG